MGGINRCLFSFVGILSGFLGLLQVRHGVHEIDSWCRTAAYEPFRVYIRELFHLSPGESRLMLCKAFTEAGRVVNLCSGSLRGCIISLCQISTPVGTLRSHHNDVSISHNLIPLLPFSILPPPSCIRPGSFRPLPTDCRPNYESTPPNKQG